MYVTYAENNRTFKEYGVWNNGTPECDRRWGPPNKCERFVSPTGYYAPSASRPATSAGGYAKPTFAPATPETILLMNGYWQRRYGGGPTILGRSITVDSRPRKVIGVMPQSFQLNGNPEIILPLRSIEPICSRPSFPGIARLKPGVSVAQSNADLQRMLPIWISRYGMQRFASLKLGGAIRPFKEAWLETYERPLDPDGRHRIVLLIACANVAALILVAQTAASRSWLSGLPWVARAHCSRAAGRKPYGRCVRRRRRPGVDLRSHSRPASYRPRNIAAPL